MAWIGIFAGMVTGLLTAALGFAVMDWPLWASALAYPAAGTVTAALIILLLALRAPASGMGGLAGSGRNEPAAI